MSVITRGNAMSSLIAFLECVGADASMRHAALIDGTAVGGGLMLSSPARAALAGGDRRTLEQLVGAMPIICCTLEKHDDDEDEDAPEHEDEIGTSAAVAAAT